MNQYQFKCIKATLEREKNSWYNEYFSLPLVRKEISDLIIRGRKISTRDVLHSYRLYRGNSIFDLYIVDIKLSSDLYIITVNNKIIYWIKSSIFAPASNAWHILTRVYHGYREDAAIYQWKSIFDFECANMSMIELTRKLWNNPSMVYHHSEYQNKKFKETGLSFIDRKTITEEQELIEINKLNLHV